jgi:hypothetical protein
MKEQENDAFYSAREENGESDRVKKMMMEV